MENCTKVQLTALSLRTPNAQSENIEKKEKKGQVCS